MFTKSIRWRIQLWLAFLLVCVLTGFGFTVYQLYRLSYFDQLDEELTRRVAALSTDLRGGRGPGGPNVPFGPFGPGGPGRPPPFDDHGPRRVRGGEHPFPEGDGPAFNRRAGKPPFDEEHGHRRRGGDGPFHDGPDGGPRRAIRLSEGTANLFDESRTNGFYFAFWSRSGTLMRASSNAPPNIIWPGGGKDTQPHTFTRGVFRETYQFTELGECALAGRWIGDDLSRVNRFTWLIIGAGGAILALGLGGSWSLARQAVRPVEQISSTASRISAGNLSERINVADTDGELGRLANVLNSTFSRLEAAFTQQKQFTADASHELRTPLTVMISEAQTTLARSRSAEEYRQTVETCLEAAQEMRRLTDSMLQLARLDAAEQKTERGPVDLAQIARHSLALVRPLAEASEIRVTQDLQPASIQGDVGLLTQVLTNLLNNAIQYNKAAGEICVTTLQDDQSAIVTVSDSGMGISRDDLPHVFERFYRADKSRSHQGGRMGLGLAICKRIIDLHRGRIEVESELGQGTQFIVRMPRE